MNPILVWNGRFVLRCRFDDKHIPKGAGFWWDKDRREWWTSDTAKAERLIQYADSSCSVYMGTLLAKRKENIAESFATDSQAIIPCPEGLSYYPFQKAGISYILARKSALLADEMGTGKTPQTIGVINSRLDIRKVLVVCPASVKRNWANELGRWLIRTLSVGIAESSQPWPETEVVIINWDILGKKCKGLDGQSKKCQRSCPLCHGSGVTLKFPRLEGPWDLVVCDESHNVKNPKTIRFRALRRIDGRYKLCLSGTPFLNKPIEIQTSLAWLDKERWGNRWKFAERYCGLCQDRFGTRMDGATNCEELGRELRAWGMIRRMKKDVLDLPPKIRQVIELPVNGSTKIVAEEWAVYRSHEQTLHGLMLAKERAKMHEDEAGYREAVKKLAEGMAAAFREMSKVRHATAVAKIPYILEHVRDCFETTSKLVVFGHHKDVIQAIKDEFPSCVAITGDTPPDKRQSIVDFFSGVEHCNLLVGNMIAAGTGLNLQVSSHICICELDWRPAIISQAEDRCHRIGTRNPVLVQHLVLEGSLDAYMAKRVIAKQEILDAVLNSNTEDPVAGEVPAEPDSIVEKTTRKEIEEHAHTLSVDDVTLIHEAIRMIAALDADRARSVNMVGFNKLDSDIGHSLAEATRLTPKMAWVAKKIAWRYRKQLPEEVSQRLENMR